MAATTVAALLVASPALAVPTCVFDAPTATVTIDVGNGETAAIARSGDAITLDGAPCDVATVTNTDAIVVNGTGIPAEVVIDLSGGEFAPGLTPETDTGNSEIEFTINLPAGSPTVRIVGSAGSDNIVSGAAGLNLNAIEAVGDADVLIVGLPTVIVGGEAGNDVLSVAGGSGTGAPSTASLDGGPDGDLLIGAAGGNSFTGGLGPDTIDYSSATQLVEANMVTGVVMHAASQLDQIAGIENLTGSPDGDTIIGDDVDNDLRGGDGADTLVGGGGNDAVDGGGGNDTVDFSSSLAGVLANLVGGSTVGQGIDTLASIENLIGSAFADQLVGDNGANVLEGGPGDDRLEGLGGDDTLDGGSDVDTLEHRLSTTAVTVNLGKGTAQGAGADTLIDIENATGTAKGDSLSGGSGANLLRGGAGADELQGRAGSDDLTGGDGRDRLFGQKGKDDLSGGPGNDQLDGGKGKPDVCSGGSGADAFVSCEKIKL
jgi:Ca2+-binding RTX toxin-like protein